MKRFKFILKRLLVITGVLSAAVLFVVVLTSAIKKQDELVCKNIQVKIDYDSGISFLNEREIKDRINYLSGGNIIGKPLSAVDFRVLEVEMEKNPFVDKAEVYLNQSQEVLVEVNQKRPILRVINNDGVSYYLSEKNERIPLSDNFTPHVAVALGSVETHENMKRDSIVQIALYSLIQQIRKDEFLNAMIDQLIVKETGEIDLIPKSDSHLIHFGLVQENEIAEKLERLKIFYKEGLNKVGWTNYKSIDLRYKNQVVCEKQENKSTL
ncbi:MAG: hypothetical protein IPP77_00645 [Bacteroidetes bacterium]|nr:hypothetical protein [Bacteroidota bacterium]